MKFEPLKPSVPMCVARNHCKQKRFKCKCKQEKLAGRRHLLFRILHFKLYRSPFRVSPAIHVFHFSCFSCFTFHSSFFMWFTFQHFTTLNISDFTFQLSHFTTASLSTFHILHLIFHISYFMFHTLHIKLYILHLICSKL